MVQLIKQAVSPDLLDTIKNLSCTTGMRNYSKVGGKPGKPAYRTPSSFKFKKSLKNKTIKAQKAKLEATVGIRYNKTKINDQRSKIKDQ